MKTIVRSLLIFCVCLALPGMSTVLAEVTPPAGIDYTLLDQTINAQMSKHGLPGVALAVIEDGEIIYLKAYGVDGNGDPLTPQTQVFIGSQSKSFTALAIAQLAEQGKLDLDATVQTYIPWFQVADEDASSQITINHLLHHTSGLSDAGYTVLLPNDTSPEEAVRSLSQARLTAPIGTEFQYFNMGYTVLGYLIEQASGQSYAEYVQEHILAPLGMNASTADPGVAPNMPHGYTRLFGFAVPAGEDYPIYSVGAGWIVSTAEDMAHYAIEFQTNQAHLVCDEMMERILTPGVGYYGMGWFIYDYGRKIVHGAANQTFRTEVNLYPNLQRSFVLLTNEGYQLDHFLSAGQLTASVEAIVTGNPPPPAGQGWSVRWIGWGIGIFVLALCALHIRNFLALRGWRERMRRATAARRVMDIAISFLIPIIITCVVIWQVSNFYGNRFNLLTSMAYMRQGLPDIFILMLVGTLPDLMQGVIKVVLISRRG